MIYREGKSPILFFFLVVVVAAVVGVSGSISALAREENIKNVEDSQSPSSEYQHGREFWGLVDLLNKKAPKRNKSESVGA